MRPPRLHLSGVNVPVKFLLPNFFFYQNSVDSEKSEKKVNKEVCALRYGMTSKIRYKKLLGGVFGMVCIRYSN